MLSQEKNLNSLSKKINISRLCLFLILEISIYIIFMYLDITGLYSYKISTALKFTGILLCWIFAVSKGLEGKFIGDKIIEGKVIGGNAKGVNAKGFDSQDNFILITALFFTMISDLFLLIFDIYLLGVFTFCFVQLLYLLRITRWNNKVKQNSKFKMEFVKNKKMENKNIKSKKTKSKKMEGKNVENKLLQNKLIQNIFASVFIMVVIYFFNFQLDLLTIISIVYFIGISRNVLEGIRIASKTRNKKHIIFAIGMFLFILCDINVGLFNMINLSYTTQNWMKEVYNFASIAMWMFYLPAQVLIALSGEV